ncbi:hypothetical protein WDW86_11940 [Bdellovibrionota bacterium FG-2]
MKRIKPQSLKGVLWSIALALIFPILSFAARDLSSAADGAVTQATSIAKALSVLGILCGAAIYQISGAVMFARGTIIGGLIGAGLCFAGPSLIGLFRMIFGG